MPDFIEVRQAGGPEQTFLVGREELDAHPDLYEVVDADPVEPPRSGKGSGITAWRQYASATGVEFAPDASIEDIIAAVDAAHQPVGDPKNGENA